MSDKDLGRERAHLGGFAPRKRKKPLRPPPTVGTEITVSYPVPPRRKPRHWIP